MKKKNEGRKNTSLLAQVMDKIEERKAYYVMWLYAPEYLPNQNITSFDELKAHYKQLNVTEKTCKDWLLEPEVQDVIKYIFKKTDMLRKAELYKKTYEKALDDPSIIKAFQTCSKDFLGEDEKTESLEDILNNM